MTSLDHHFLWDWRIVQRQSWAFVRRHDRSFQGIYVFLPRPCGGWKIAIWVRVKTSNGIIYPDHRQVHLEALHHTAWLWRTDPERLAKLFGHALHAFPRGRVSGANGLWRLDRGSVSPVRGEFRRVCRVFRLERSSTLEARTPYHKINLKEFLGLMAILQSSSKGPTPFGQKCEPTS